MLRMFVYEKESRNVEVNDDLNPVNEDEIWKYKCIGEREEDLSILRMRDSTGVDRDECEVAVEAIILDVVSRVQVRSSSM